MNVLRIVGVWMVLGAACAAEGESRLMPYNANGKWGFIARDAARVEFVLQPAHELAFPFASGRAAVRQNKQWGFIDEKGAVAIPFQFDDVQRGMFQGGVAVIKKGNLWGVVGPDGKEILPAKFMSVSVDEKAARITAAVSDGADPNNFLGLFGLYDTTGRMLMPHEYKEIYAWFKNGVTAVDKGGKKGLASANGELLTPLQYEQILHGDITHFIAVKDGGKTNDVYDEHGKLLFSAPYPYVGALRDNRCVFKDPATKNNGYLDAQGKIVLPAQFFMAGNFSEGLAIVQRKLGAPIEAIDANGNSVGSVPNAFIRLDKFKNGFLWLADKTDKKIYLYNKQLQRVTPQGFYYAADFDAAGFARAQAEAKKNGLINTKGEWVIQPEWTQLEASSIPGQYIVSKDREKGIVSSAGQVLFKPQAVGIEKWDEQFVKISPPGFMMGNEYHCFWRHDGVFFYDNKGQP